MTAARNPQAISDEADGTQVGAQALAEGMARMAERAGAAGRRARNGHQSNSG